MWNVSRFSMFVFLFVKSNSKHRQTTFFINNECNKCPAEWVIHENLLVGSLPQKEIASLKICMCLNPSFVDLTMEHFQNPHIMLPQTQNIYFFVWLAVGYVYFLGKTRIYAVSSGSQSLKNAWGGTLNVAGPPQCGLTAVLRLLGPLLLVRLLTGSRCSPLRWLLSTGGCLRRGGRGRRCGGAGCWGAAAVRDLDACCFPSETC